LSTPTSLEGALDDRLLPSVLGEILRRELSGRLILEADGNRFLDLLVGGGLGATSVGDTEEAVGLAVRIPSGRYRLEPGEGPGDKGLPLARLILRATRDVGDIQRIQAALGGAKAPLALTPLGATGGSELGLTAQEGFLLSRIDGQSGIEAICQLSPDGENETIRALYGLTAAGLIRLQGRQVQAPRQQVDPLSKLDGFLKKTGVAEPAAPAIASAPTPPPGANTGGSAPAAGTARTPPAAKLSPEHQRLEQRLRCGSRPGLWSHHCDGTDRHCTDLRH
jgi:hypothetical protein